jgi:NAD(P)-dependent dehydrogenase (short-subunit alcohol dehydrogenase family)
MTRRIAYYQGAPDGLKALAVRTDASDVDAVKAAVAKTVQSFGRVDILVNTAGAFAQRPLDNMDQQPVTALFATNIIGPTLLSQAALPYLKMPQGSIVNISSTFGHKAAPMISHYAASKAALEHLTCCWALEPAPYRIRVNAVAPGPMATGILERSGLPTALVEHIKEEEVERAPPGRRGTPEEVAAWIVDLATPTASWMTGQVRAVNGGRCMA